MTAVSNMQGGTTTLWVRPVVFVVTLLWGVFSLRADEFDTLRLKWRDLLTMGTNANAGDPLYANWISSTANNAQRYWSTMNTAAGRTCLWNDLNELASNSLDITSSYMRLKAMAMGYAVHGSSLESNATMRSAIVGGLNWMHSNCYNENKTEFDNWYDWEIATPLHLNDATVLMYDDLSPSQIANYMNAVHHFTPVPDGTGANRVWKASVVAVSGLVTRDGAKLAGARDALSDVFRYVTNGDGFYIDGSFIFHNDIPYNGGYGSQLIETIGPLMQLLSDSSWAVEDPAQTNVFRWIYDSFEPFIYRGALMQMVDGRYYTREGDDHAEGSQVIASILRFAQFAPPADALAYQRMAKYWIQADTYSSFTAAQPPPYNRWAREILTNTSIVTRGEKVRHYQFPHMDCAVHLRPGWGFALAMSSSRVANYESIRQENLRGWHTHEGMTYLYNGDLGHYADHYWPTVNPYRLPGTTVDSQSRADGSGEGYLSPNDWTGGASIEGLYGVSGMQLNAWESTLTAKKSWFMFDNEVVCLGSGITSSDERTIETIIENRRLSGYGNNPFTVNGAVRPGAVGWSETLTNTSWAHLAGNGVDADIGYFFPQPAAIRMLREARSGSLYDLNNAYGATNGNTRSFLTLWCDHGANPTNAAYAYVLLPNQSAAQIAGYASNPDIVVLQNNTKAQGVREKTLGITAVNFWKDGTNRVGVITADKMSSVILRDDGTVLGLGVSDPTQNSTGSIHLEIHTPAFFTMAADPEITVQQLSPTIKMVVHASGTGGRTLQARFFVGSVQSLVLEPAADAYVQNGDQSNVNFGAAQTLAAKSSTNSPTRETYLRFDLPPGPWAVLDATLRMVPVTLNEPMYHALAYVPDHSWSEASLTWDNRPASDPEYARWFASAVGAPVFASLTALAQQSAASSRQLSLRLYSVGMPPATNGGYTAYCSKENGVVANRPQLILTLGQMPPAILLTHLGNDTVFDEPAAVTLEAISQGPDGTVTRVEFFSGDTRVAHMDTAPYRLALSNLGVGTYVYTAVATGPGGLIATSAPVTFAVYRPEPAGRGTGLTGEYCTTQNLIGLAVTRRDPQVNFSWGSGAPDPAIPPDRFSVRWTGKLQARRAGTHQFQTISDEGVRLWMNGQLVIDNWSAHSVATNTANLSLVPGEYYDIALEYYDGTGAAVIQLYWTPPGGAPELIPETQLYPADGGLRGIYYASTNLTRSTFSRIDEAVRFDWGTGSPDPTLFRDGFSVRWTGKVRSNQSGIYTFSTLSAGGVKLWVNNQLVISNWTTHSATEDTGWLTLAAGQFYNLTMEYSSGRGESTAVLLWTPPGESKQVIPRTHLTPHQNNSPPVLESLPNLATAPGSTLTFAAGASDADAPNQMLLFSLDPGAPVGASLHPVSGQFSWTTPETQAPGDYSVNVRVTDNGNPVMTDAQTVRLTVITNAVPASVTLVPAGSVWGYLDHGTDLGKAWLSNNFDDATWEQGPARLGYGSGHEARSVSFGPDPNLKYTTTYLRRTFFVPDAQRLQNLRARLLRDDGAVVYINGVEVWRENMPAGAVNYSTLASAPINGSVETNFLTQSFNPMLVTSGTNLIAVEIHQSSPDGSDIGFDFELTATALVPPRPVLAVVPYGDGILIQWPQEAGLFQLFTATNLIQPIGWDRATNASVLLDGQWTVLLPGPIETPRYYRLQTQ